MGTWLLSALQGMGWAAGAVLITRDGTVWRILGAVLLIIATKSFIKECVRESLREHYEAIHASTEDGELAEDAPA